MFRPSILVLSVAAVSVSAPIKADDTLAKIGRALSKSSMICANFTQRKSLRVLTQTLISRGSLVSIAKKGVIWRISQPFRTRVLIKNDALIVWENGDEQRRVDIGRTQVLHSLSRVFLAVLRGRMDRLSDTFEIESDVSSSNWRLDLKPREAVFAAIISRIRASGSRFVDELRIEEERGDRTVITFSDMRTGPCPLYDDEKHYFAN